MSSRRIKTLKKIIATALLLSLIGVNTMPAFAINSSETTAPKTKKSLFARKVKKNNNEYKYNYVNLEWWDSFGDEYLSAYIREAIDKNHDIKASTLVKQEYYQAMKAQFASELPQVGAGFFPGYSKMIGTTSSHWGFALPIYASYELDLFGKNRNKTQSTKKTYESSIQDERAAHISVASAVGTTYLNIVQMDELLKVQEEIVSLRENLLNLEKLRYDEGISSSMDVVNSEKSFITSQNNLIELKKQHYKLLNQFAVLIGESPENVEKIQRKSLEDLNYTKEIPSEISTEVITNRPDYLKAEILVQKAGLDVKVAKKEFLPSFNLGGFGLFNARDLGSLFTTKNMLIGFGGGVLMPLFTGGQRVANLRMKKATYERIMENYLQTNLTSIQEVNDALYVLKSDDERYNQLVKQYQLESENYKLNEQKFTQGIISKYDLERYQENLLTLKQQLTQYKTERLTGFIGLYKSTGSQL